MKRVILPFLIPALLLVGTLIAAPSGKARPNFALTDGLIAHWGMDEASGSRADATGNHGLTEATDAITATLGVVDNAAYPLNGNYFTSPDSSDWTFSSEWTVTGWISTTTTTYKRGIIGHWGVAGDRSWIVGVDNDLLTMQVSADGTTVSSVSSLQTIPDGEWVFIAAWKTADGEIAVQINDHRVTATWANTVHDSTDTLYVGNWVNNSKYWGLMDNLNVWDRALTQSELGDLYNGGLSCAYPYTDCEAEIAPPLPEGCWDLNEPTTTGYRYDYYETTNLTVTNGIVGSSDGIVDNATVFSATIGWDGDLRADDNDVVGITNTAQAFTFAGWFYLDDDAYDHRIVGKGRSTLSQENEYGFGQTAGNYYIEIGNGTAYKRLQYYLQPIVESQWQFVVGWYNPYSQTLSVQVGDYIYNVEGTTVGTQDTARGFGTIGFSKGRVDSLVFWKDLLTAAQVRWLYNSGAGRSCQAIDEGVNPPEPPVVGVCPYTLTEMQSGAVDAGAIIGDDLSMMYVEDAPLYAIDIISPPFWDEDVPGYLSFDADLASEFPVMVQDWWDELTLYPGVVCTETLTDPVGYRVVFDRLDDPSPVWSIRAHDEGSRANNMMELNYILYAADYSPPEAACAANYSVDGWVTNDYIDPTEENGVPMVMDDPMYVSDWYLIEISGYWYDHGVGKLLFDISTDGGGSWAPLETWAQSQEICIAFPEYDMIRVYIQPQPGAAYRLRVADDAGDYSDNTGMPRYDLYMVTSIELPGGYCLDQFALGDVVTTGSISAREAQGGEVYTATVPDQLYALEITAPPWFDGDYMVMSSEADFSTGPHDPVPYTHWYKLGDFPGALCAETVNGYYGRVFFTAQEDDTYLLRAHDPSMDWANNGGDVNYVLYTAVISDTNWSASCESDFTAGYWIGGHDIDVTSSDGDTIISNPGEIRWLRVDVSGGPITDGSLSSYDVEVSDNGGLTWQDIATADFATCIVLLTDGKHYRIYFMAETTKTYKIRVGDATANWGDNSGTISYDVYSTQLIPDVGNTQPPAWDVNPACYAQCIRPTALDEGADWLERIGQRITSIPLWLEYGRCRISKLAVWCPYHTSVITSIPNKFYSREPFATMFVMRETSAELNEMFNAYDWGDDVGGADSDFVDILTTLPDESPYMYGEINIMPDETIPYDEFCQKELNEVIGVKLSLGVCIIFDILDYIGVISFFQFVYDLSLIVGLMFYLGNKWLYNH